MQNFINVSANDKLQSLIGIVNDVAPFVVKNFYHVMQTKFYATWYDHCYDRTENSAIVMIDLLMNDLYKCLPDNVYTEVKARYQDAIQYQEQAIYNQLDTDEQYDQDEFWEAMDSQSDFDDKINMYYNEF